MTLDRNISIRHPAKYSDELMPTLQRLLVGYKRVLDPFAGTGKLRQICPDATLLEIEPEWAAINGAIVGDVLDMPSDWTGSFDAICTSPCYGNRMADSFIDHQVDKKYRRNTYTHALGRKLHPNNSGQLQWGNKYKEFHVRAWAECHRVLKEDGVLILNISDHIRNGEVQNVTDWHIETLCSLGFEVVEHIRIKTPRLRYGKNYESRVDGESIIVFKKVSSPEA